MTPNAGFRYRLAQQATTDSNGMPVATGSDEWKHGCFCHVQKTEDAKFKGADGADVSCQYRMFLPRIYCGIFHVGDEVEIIFRHNSVVRTITSVDDINKRFVILWV